MDLTLSELVMVTQLYKGPSVPAGGPHSSISVPIIFPKPGVISCNVLLPELVIVLASLAMLTLALKSKWARFCKDRATRRWLKVVPNVGVAKRAYSRVRPHDRGSMRPTHGQVPRFYLLLQLRS